MQGFILSVKDAKNEDAVAIVLTKTEIRSYYRFFGKRHSILQAGNLVNFEVEGEKTQFLPRLRRLSRLDFPWMMDKEKMKLWQEFLQQLLPHLQNREMIEDFYYQMLLLASKHWEKQNNKRIICESYISLLAHENRLSFSNTCFICQDELQEEVSVMQGFKLAHPHCIHNPALPTQKILACFKSKKTIFLEDKEVDILFDVFMKGL